MNGKPATLPHMTQFTEECDRLNPAQRLAVETIEGPVMVVAGPGTGKTQVLGMRVANILQKTQMRPGNILCLTFSTSGAAAMRERLRRLIGPDAYGVKVSTIHGFCNEIITMHPQVFEDWSARQQITDLDRYRELNMIIDHMMPHLELVNRKHPYSRTKDILWRISQLKKEGKDDFQELKHIADRHAALMAEKSKPGTRQHERNLLQAKKFQELVTLYERYQEMLRRTDRYDYDDMILHVLRALREEEWMLQSLQEKYQYVLVDEYQDTNGAQAQFIELLTTYPTPDAAPNLFAVGDDDQAIYRFQGANLTNLLQFHARFPGAPVIALTVNYRSTQAILDAAGSLIGHNTERLVGRIPGLQKQLLAGADPGGQPEPKMVYAASDTVEPWLVADLVAERLERGVDPQEIAVLTWTNGEVLLLYEVLRARNIPVQVQGKVDLLNHPLIKQVLCVLKGVEYPQDDSLLRDAIACERLGCHPADLGRLYVLRRESGGSLMDLLLKIEVIAHAGSVAFTDLASLVKARDCILNLHHRRRSRTVVNTVEALLRDCAFLEEEREGMIDPLEFSAIQAFFNHVCSRANGNPVYQFGDLVNELALYESPEYGDLRLQYAVPRLHESGVQLMTAHQSKGREFHTVIITDFREGQWDGRRTPAALAVPEDLLFGWTRDQKAFEQDQDERRVAFVAMTRAKRELLFTCPRQTVSGDRARPVSPSGFFAQAGTLPEEEREVRDGDLASLLIVRPVRDLSAEERAFLREQLEHFSLSPTALNHFLEDPRLFLERDLLRAPQPLQPEFLFGSAMHRALQAWGMSVQQGQPLGREEVFSVFERTVMETGVATEQLRRALVEDGRDVLPRYYDACLAVSRPFIDRLESTLTAQLTDPERPDLPGIPLKGKVDRVDRLDADSSLATVWDYKTGASKTEKEIREGDLYRQITFYSLLFDAGNMLLTPQSFILEFLGGKAESPVSRVFQIPETDRQDLTRVIRAVWTKIQALDFTPL